MIMQKAFCVGLILYAGLLELVSCSPKYEHISDCKYESVFGENSGADNLTIICDTDLVELFHEGYFNCSHRQQLQYRYTGTIDFKNCRLKWLDLNFFEKFTDLHTIIISDLGLEQLDMTTNPNSLTNIDASQNRITEIPSEVFPYDLDLQYVNLSNNIIRDINPFGFAEAFNLETLDLSENLIITFKAQYIQDQNKLKVLNLSHNEINSLDLRNMSARSLVTLDVSHNVLTTLIDHTFDELTELVELDLSFNPIVNLKVETFAYLSKLEQLNLRKMKISSIQLGTFSHQHILISLDLSENALTDIDFNLFLPRLENLRTLNLAENQLTELIDFHNSLFPRLNEFDIQNNRFNCTYLQHFLKSVDRKGIHLVVDLISVYQGGSKVRGIKCEQFNRRETLDGTATSSHKSNADMYCLTFICGVIAAFFGIFLWSNRGKMIKLISGL